MCGKINFATTICFFRFNGKNLKPEIFHHWFLHVKYVQNKNARYNFQVKIKLKGVKSYCFSSEIWSSETPMVCLNGTWVKYKSPKIILKFTNPVRSLLKNILQVFYAPLTCEMSNSTDTWTAGLLIVCTVPCNSYMCKWTNAQSIKSVGVISVFF